MKLKRKLMGLTLAVCMAAGLLPAEVSAAGTDTGKAIQLVEDGSAANIIGEQGSNVYYGMYLQSSDGNGGYNTDPIKWRVLSNEKGTQPDEGDKLFLLADQNLDVVRYNESFTSITWAESTIRSWLNGYDDNENKDRVDYSADDADSFLGSAFSGTEKSAISKTAIANKNNGSIPGGANTDDYIFLLSLEEVQESAYGFSSNTDRVATNTAYAVDGYGGGGWWLRSPGTYGNCAAVVYDDGSVNDIGGAVNYAHHAGRPAFKLNLESVLFTSAAEGGKIPAASGGGNSSGAAVGEIFEIGPATGDDWKMTLLDSGRNFKVSESEVTGKEGGTIALNYTGATVKTDTAPNEYISVMITDSTGRAIYYGRIIQPTEADGTVELTLPDSLAEGVYTLKVFSEQYNGGENDDTKLTDYGSAFSEVALKIDNTAPTLTAGEVTRTSDTNATVKFTSNEAGTYYYEVLEGGASQPIIDTTGAGTACDTSEQTITLDNLTAGAKDIYIAVKDGVGNVSALKIEIPAYVPPSHGISASPSALDFGTLTEGYASVPEAQTVIVENTGNQSVTVTLPVSTSYAITAGAGFEADGTAKLDVSGTAQFTVQPKTGLAARDYNETLAISGTGATQTSTAQASVALSLHVHKVTQVSGKEASCTEEGSKAYYTCTVCGKAFEDQECTKEIADLESWRVIPVKEHTYESGRCTQCNGIDPDFRPVITEGAGSVWKKGSKDTLSFRSDAGYADFLKVQVDGNDVAVTDYEVSEGSTIVTLKSSYLESLSVGVHTLAVVSQTGTAEATFTIQQGESGGGETPKTEDEATKAGSGTSLTGGGDSKAGSDTSNTGDKAPGTGDDSRAALWGMLALFAGVCGAKAVLVRRKKMR